MRILAAALSILVALPGCLTTFEARSEDVARSRLAGGDADWVQADDGDGDPTEIDVDAVFSVGEPDAEGRRRLRVEDGRKTLALGLTLVGVGLATVTAVGLFADHGDDSAPVFMTGMVVTGPLVVSGLALVVNGLFVGSPER